MSCEICGKPSGYYPICNDCNELKKEGEVKKCDECGKWYKVSEGHDCENKESKFPKEDECIVCDDDSNGKPLCYDCYKEKERLKKELESDRSPEEIKNHYFNQKRALYKVDNPDYTQTGTIKLLSLSEELSTFHDNYYLKERVIDDIRALRKSQESEKEKEEDEKPLLMIKILESNSRQNINVKMDIT